GGRGVGRSGANWEAYHETPEVAARGWSRCAAAFSAGRDDPDDSSGVEQQREPPRLLESPVSGSHRLLQVRPAGQEQRARVAHQWWQGGGPELLQLVLAWRPLGAVGGEGRARP